MYVARRAIYQLGLPRSGQSNVSPSARSVVGDTTSVGNIHSKQRSSSRSAGGKDTIEFEGEFFLGKKFYEKGMKKFSGRENFGGEISGAIMLKKNLRHTDGVKRGNVRSMKNGREMIFADDRN